MGTLDLSKLQQARGLGAAQLRTQLPDVAAEITPLQQAASGERILTALNLPDDVRARIGAIDTSKGGDDVVAQLKTKLTALQVPAAQIDSLVAAANDISTRLASVDLHATDAALGKKIQATQVQTVGRLAGLTEDQATLISTNSTSLAALDDVALDQLVTARQLTDAQAKSVGFAASIFSLADQNDDLATAIHAAKFAPLQGAALASTEDLAKLTARDWTDFFTANPAVKPAGSTPADAGAIMADRIAALHPGLSLVARLPVVVAAMATQQLTSLSALLARNPSVVGAEFSALDASALTPVQIEQARAAHSALRGLANSYPGLQLAALLDDKTNQPADKIATLTRRIGYVNAVAAKLGDTALTALDLSDSAGAAQLQLNTLGANAAEEAMTLQTFRAYQRLWILAGSADDAHALAAAGHDSAVSIAALHLADFQTQTGFVADKARAVWSAARHTLADSTLTVGSIVDIFGGLFNKLGVANQPPTVEEYLKKLAGFQDFFGNISFCHCEECASIVGPAAYFVDLMKFIDENLRTQFAGKPNHPLDLKYRRPDLWTLELSCDNVNNRVPTLDLVNVVLENHIATRLGFAGNFGDRQAVGALVYQNTLTQTATSPAQPFSVPIARVAAYMNALSANLSDVAVAVAAPAAMRAQAELRISRHEREIIAAADPDMGRLGAWYGVAFVGAPNAVANVDAAVMAPVLHLSRAELGALAATKFVQTAAPVKIAAAKRDADSVQNDVEWVSGLTADALDRMHRFSRLARRAGWSAPELDQCLAALGAAALNEAALEGVAALHGVQNSFGLSVAEFCALVGAVPTDPAGTSLFDRAFNPPSFVASDGAWPKPGTHFIHPAFRQNSAAPVDPAQPRLLTGLDVDLDGLADLARHLARHLAQDAATGFDPAAPNDADRYFALSAPNLTLLYRHARLARLLRLSIGDLFQLLGLLGLDRVSGLADLQALLDLWNWWTSSGYRLDEAAVAVGQAPRDATKFHDPAAVAADLVTSIGAQLLFKDTVFAVSLGVSEQASRDLIAANAAVFETTPDGNWRLKAGVDLTNVAIAIPPSATVKTPPAGSRLVTDAETRAALRPYLAAEILVRSLGATFNVVTAKLNALATLAGVSLIADAVVRAARGDGPLAPLTALVATLRPLATALAASAWDAAAIDFLRQHAGLFGDGALPRTVADALHPNAPYVTLSQLRAISTYAGIAARKTGLAADAPLVDPADIRAVLAGFQAGPPPLFPAATDAAMARCLVVPSGLVVGLRGRVTLPAVAAAALDQLDRAAQLALAIGIDGETLGALASDDYAALTHAADALTAALRARYQDETTRAAQLDLAEQPVREAKRDAAAEYLLRSINPKPWKTLDDLYEYFLIDVDSGGCATTSPVVAATMSAQLYVYRAIMNLEQDALPPTDPKHVSLRLAADAAAEWDWRRNYRVWQANRKVFLWPENYLDPDLRDDKTPLFKTLEQELLQTDIDDQNVLDAYTAYLAGFEEVAKLRIAGAYHDVVWSWPSFSGRGRFTRRRITRDVLHLFGCTADDPPVYYYRTCENLIASGTDPNTAAVWSPWQKVTVQITGRRVAPVVHLGRLHVFWTDVKTRPVNDVSNGASTFAGYRHNMTLHFTTLRADGAWTPPQTVQLPGNFGFGNFGPARGQVVDPRVITATVTMNGVIPVITIHDEIKYDIQKRKQTEAIDDYTLEGPNWDGVWPLPWNIGGVAGLEIQYRNFVQRQQIDLFDRVAFDLPDPWRTDVSAPYPQLLCAKAGVGVMPLYCGRPSWMAWPNPAYANAVIDERRLNVIELDAPGLKPFLIGGLYAAQVATIPDSTALLAVPGSPQDGLLQVGNDILLLQGSVLTDGRYLLRRLGTTLVHDIARRLFEDGVDQLLDIRTQNALAEAGAPISVTGRVVNRVNAGALDFTGPYGVYYRELFFHIPFLIANALNGRGRYAASQKWYHHIFDPTSTEVIDVSGAPPADVAHRLLDRVWRYREFRGLNVDHLRDVLTDPAAIALYRKDPFNPWAIARRRISALQKTIVMKYVANLVDWADSLFSQFTMESVNEATMLYVMASDILGPRPVELGDCGNKVEPKTYDHIAPLIDKSGEILIELETWTIGWRNQRAALPPASKSKYGVNWGALTQALAAHPLQARVAAAERVPGTGALPQPGLVAAAESSNMFSGLGWTEQRTASWAPAGAASAIKSRDALGGRGFDNVSKANFPEWVGRFGWHIVRQISPVFCVPANTDLLDYWTRIEDRLYKIRHCMDINGNRRELALFAPPIDPMQLVRMKAAGLSLDDVLGASNGDLPPYRFLYLVDRAKALAAALSGFGAALLSAIEKRDLEEMNRLRLTQQINLTALTTKLRQFDIDSAVESLEAVNRQLDSAQYRSDYYGGLIAQDRSGWEAAESVMRHIVSGIYVVEAVIDGLSAVFAALPQVGSPFAMKYGGVELNTTLRRAGNALSATAEGTSAIASSMAVEGGFARRSENWRNQKALADYDVKSLTRQAKAASIRVDVATRAMELHEKSIDQLQEMLDLTDGKFTNHGLYVWLSAQLQRLYRGAWQNALALAKLAEQAYRFERGDDGGAGLSATYWDPGHLGLLSGEALLIDLQTMERRFLETNYRQLEIDQAFSLSQIDPAALVKLRQNGECVFTIAETFFDLAYPGHYKRRIKAVRLTIPSVTGPYVNVSATLNLTRSWLRPKADPGAALVEVPPSRSVSIAASTAQNDAGVFELSFRDERYMPFEGLGAVSQWSLSLPKAFRQFDYETINDVILSISYTAEQDGALRDRVEAQNAQLAGSIVNYFSNTPARRLFSLRQDFSAVFTRLLRSAPGTQAQITISDRNFPLFAQGRNIQVQRAVLLLRTAVGVAPTGVVLQIDGTAVNAFAADPTLGDLPGAALPGAFAANLKATHTITVQAAGNLAPAAPLPGDASAIDAAKLEDMLMYVEYLFA